MVAEWNFLGKRKTSHPNLFPDSPADENELSDSGGGFVTLHIVPVHKENSGSL